VSLNRLCLLIHWFYMNIVISCTSIVGVANTFIKLNTYFQLSDQIKLDVC
jgi:hypothetical protein